MPDRLLDTSVVSALMRRDPAAVARLASRPVGDVLYLSVVTHAEIRYGLYRLPAGRRRREMERAYERLIPHFGRSLEVTVEIADLYARTKAGLERRGITLPGNDLWIAATALVRQLIVVANDDHFEAISALNTENWSGSS